MVQSATLAGQPVAVKILNHQHKDNSLALHDIQLETELLSRMSNKHILKLFGYGWHDGCPFMVMERLKSSLSQKLLLSSSMSRYGQKGRLGSALSIGEQLVSAMHYIHDEAFPGHQV